MSELHLIAHKVRGEAAFDVAINIGDETGDLWIIPTSGHRAYPYWYAELGSMQCARLVDVPAMPPETPDHYHCNDTFRKPKPYIPEPESTLEDLI